MMKKFKALVTAEVIKEKIEIKDINRNTKTINEYGVIPIIKNLKIKFSDECIGEIEINKEK